MLDKHAAVSFVAMVRDQLGLSVANSAVVAEWALGKVERVALKNVGKRCIGTCAGASQL